MKTGLFCGTFRTFPCCKMMTFSRKSNNVSPKNIQEEALTAFMAKRGFLISPAGIPCSQRLHWTEEARFSAFDGKVHYYRPLIMTGSRSGVPSLPFR